MVNVEGGAIRAPDVKFVFSHAGGTVPYLAGRFGSDYPYLRRDLAVSCRQHIQASPELTNSERMAVLGGTATKLIPQLASLRSQAQRQAS
jgi:hypothetical protein